MRRIVLGVAAFSFAIAAVGAHAVEDPILTRQKIMKANGAQAGAASGMLKEEIPFSAAVARAVLVSMNAAAFTFGDHFPAGSDTGETKASPKIWEDAAGFAAALQKFQQDADAAVKADPQDLEAFKAAFGQVAGNCKSCHDNYRLADN